MSSDGLLLHGAINSGSEVQPSSAPTRYFALDSVRATAMLLGVFYHLPIAFMGMGFGMGFGFGASPKTSIDNWLHSFRMPLFFLISGFFANMMLGKYGARHYLLRRWWRIGAPLVIAMIVLVGVRISTSVLRSSQPSAFGPTAPGFGGFGLPATGFGAPGQPPAGGFGGANGVARPSPFGSPVAGFGAPGQAPQAGANGGGPGPFPFGGFGGATPAAGPAAGFGPPGNSPFGGPGVPAAASPFSMPTFPSHPWADKLFGKYSQFVNLEHLWFLWYLLVFVTVGPLVAHLVALLFLRSSSGRIDRIGRGLLRWNCLAIVFGLISVPALIHAHGFTGWSLANPIGFMGAFPDFLFQYYADVPFYFFYFLSGWWLFRLRDGLDDLARTWLWNLVLGIAGFAASQALSDTYSMQTNLSHYNWIRLGSFALYALGTALSAVGFLGFFQRFLNRPTRLSRYFADTALWIYLVHLPLIPYLMWWIEPSRAAWWGSSLAGMILVTGVCLVLFELCVRPTILMHVFGPPIARRPAADRSAAIDSLATGSAAAQ